MTIPFTVQLTHVNCAEINKQPLFHTRFAGEPSQLKPSIKNFGILYPLRLWHSQKCLHIIDGVERFNVAGELGLNAVPCIVYNDNQLSEQDAFLLCLELNRLSRGFNDVEKALCLQHAEGSFGAETIPSLFWDIVGLKKDDRVMHNARELLKLPKVILEYAVSHHIAVSVILNFLRFDNSEIEKLASQILPLSLNQNKLSEILGLLFDITRREKFSVSEILDQALQHLSEQTDAMQREGRLRAYLQQRRHPLLKDKLEKFAAKLKSLPMKEDTKVSPAPYFEDDYIDLRTRLHNANDINALIELLKKKEFYNLIKDL